MRIYRKLFPFFFPLIVTIAGCTVKSDIHISDVWARPGLAEGNSAVFFIVENSTNEDDTILSASSDIAEAVELHKSTLVDDVMKMEKQEFVPVPAGEDVFFKPGGLHVMLIGLEKDLMVGDEFGLLLTLENGGEISLNVVVKEP